MVVNIRTIRTGATTSGTPPVTQDFVPSGETDTPVFAIVICARTVSDGARTDHAAMSVGFTDGTNDRCMAYRDRNGQTTSSNLHVGSDAYVIWLPKSAVTSKEASATASFISGGVRLTWDDLPPISALVTMVIYYGDITVAVGDFDPSTSEDGTATVTGLSAMPQQALFMRNNGALDETTRSDLKWSIGAADRTNNGPGTAIEQATYGGHLEDNVGIADYAAGAVSNSYIIQMVSTTLTGFPPTRVPQLDEAYELTEWTSDGFEVTTRDGTSNGEPIIYAAMSFDDGEDHSLEFGITPSTATTDDTQVNYEPQGAFGIQTNVNTGSVDTAVSGNQAVTFALSAFVGTTAFSDEYSNCITCRSGGATSTSECKTKSAARAVSMPNPPNTGDINADVDSLNNDDWTLDYTEILGTQKYWWRIGVSEDPTNTRAVGAFDSYAINRDISESVDIAEGAFDAYAISRDISESVDIAEAADGIIGLLKAHDESVDLAENTGGCRGVGVDESIDLSEIATRGIMPWVEGEGVSIRIRETPARAGGFNRSVDESVDIAEDTQHQFPRTLFIDESVDVAEDVQSIVTLRNIHRPRGDTATGGVSVADSAMAGVRESDSAGGGVNPGGTASGGVLVGADGLDSTNG